MPVRTPTGENELITREFQKGNFITRPKWEWEQGDKRKAIYEQWNKDITTELEKLAKIYPKYILEARSFNTLTEGVGKEKFSDNRNYLAKEVVEIRSDSSKKVIFSGNFTNLEDLIKHIKVTIDG